MTQGASPEYAPRPRPFSEFAVRITPPDLTPWRSGNLGLPGFIQRRAAQPGPHVAILSLMHGNEFSGAIVLDALLRAGIAPLCGTLTLGFVNLLAFDSFDPNNPTSSRFVDEDLNRLWDIETLNSRRTSHELSRARQLMPLLETVDVLLDLHSMLWPSEPLILAGPSERGMAMARALPVPPLVVADHGHAGGRRLIDHPRFAEPSGTARGNLLEAGQHWQPETVALAAQVVQALLEQTGIIASSSTPRVSAPPRQITTVTHTIAAATGQFAFVAPYHGGEVIPHRNTLIALDGTAEIRTPYDNCLLVMPSLRASRGHTAVRLAQIEAA